MKCLQFTRAVAALMVVYFHTSILLGRPPFPSDFSPLPIAGKCGVDIFFVLSGFLMWLTTRQDEKIGRFYLRRFLRVVPLYWLFTVLAALIALSAPSLLRSVKFDGRHLVASLLFLPWPNPAMQGGPADRFSPLLIVGWTLDFEAFFYILFGLALVGPAVYRLPTLVGLFLVVIFGVRLFSSEAVIEFYNPILITEFLSGVAVAMLLKKDHTLRWNIAMPLFVISLFFIVYIDPAQASTSKQAADAVLATSIIYCAVCIEFAQRWPSTCSSTIRILADSSYSIYLSHVFTLGLIRLICQRIHPPVSCPFLVLTVCLVSCVLVGTMLSLVIERPMTKYLKQLLRRPLEERFGSSPKSRSGKMLNRENRL